MFQVQYGVRNGPALFSLSASWCVRGRTYFCDCDNLPTLVDQVRRSHRTTRLSNRGTLGGDDAAREQKICAAKRPARGPSWLTASSAC